MFDEFFGAFSINNFPVWARIPVILVGTIITLMIMGKLSDTDDDSDSNKDK